MPLKQKNMHSTLFQIATSPIEEENLLTENSIPFGEGTDLDYLDERTDKARLELIKVLVDEVMPHGMFIIEGEDQLVYQGGYQEWAEKWVKDIHEKARAVTVENVTEWIGPAYQLQKAVENPFDCGTRFCIDGDTAPEQSAVLMATVARMKKGDSLYIGSVFNFHW